jgi:hypothetical protein
MEQLKIQKIDQAVLIFEAFEDHVAFGGEKKLEDVSSHDLNHIVLNYIRHHYVRGYNHVRFENQWQYFSWFSKVSRAIAKTYPFLEQTVEQQIRRKESKIALQQYASDEWESL